MLLADRFADDAEYREQAFGSHIDDHPLVVQFAANEPSVFARAALCAQEMGADAVDLNLGCPQDRARLGHYGSFLTDPCDWQLCADIIAAAVAVVSIPVTVKIRLQPTVEATITFARMLKEAGASLITVHGRQRGSENNRRDGSADLEAVAEVVKALHPLPVASSYHCVFTFFSYL
jgi:tRNA-dihydrouridine synthase 1